MATVIGDGFLRDEVMRGVAESDSIAVFLLLQESQVSSRSSVHRHDDIRTGGYLLDRYVNHVTGFR